MMKQEQITMINQMTMTHLIESALHTLASLDHLEADGKLHAFAGANSSTTGYYRMTPDNKECSMTVDYFHGNNEGTATVTFLLEQVEVNECH